LTAEGYTLASDGIKATGILSHRPFIKWYNRKCAVRLMEAEKFSVFASSLKFNYPNEKINTFLGATVDGESGKFNYPQSEINSTLKKYLMWQHHDNLPGNFTWDGIDIALNDYKTIYNTFNNILDSALLTIGAQVNTEGAGIPVLVFNSLSWRRTDVVDISLDRIGNPQAISVMDSDGKIVPSQISSDGRKRVVFLAEDIPATGYKTYRLIPGERSSQKAASGGVSADEKNLIFESEHFVLEMDRKTGFWKRVSDKANKREVLDGWGNILGSANYDAWPYGEGFDEWGTDLEGADSIEVVESGPVRVKIRVRHGVVYQDTIIYQKLKRIDCFVWSENYKDGGAPYLRVVFHLNVPDGIYTTEGPYGYSESPDKNTNLEKPTLSWQDLSAADYGVSLINDSKYGGDRDGGSIKLSLISHAEFDHQEMLYSLYPHRGGWREGNTQRASYEVNYPLIVRVEKNHRGLLPESYSFVEASPENLIVSVVKRHEDSGDAIVRVYETAGRKVNANLTFSGGVLNAREIDMMEWTENPQDLSITDESIVNFEIGPYEIKTLRVKLPEFFGNRVFVELPKKIHFVQGSPSGFTVKLNNARTGRESVKLNVSFPDDVKIGAKSLETEIESGAVKELTVNIETPQSIIRGEMTLEYAYGKRKEIKKIPYEVMPSIEKLGEYEFTLYKVWEAEDLNHRIGTRIMDESADNGIAWQAAAGVDGANDHLVFGPYEVLPEGKYVVFYRMKVKEKVSENIAAIDVFSAPKEVPTLAAAKAQDNLKGVDFAEAGVYQEFPLMFTQPADYRNEFRVFWTGTTSLWIDRIIAFKIVKK
ncbi:MAG: glycoside hydrolase family 38 C-terminal domain-containing protein, partial [bacterium]